jgi:hypothetical protein
MLKQFDLRFNTTNGGHHGIGLIVLDREVTTEKGTATNLGVSCKYARLDTPDRVTRVCVRKLIDFRSGKLI